LAGCPPAGDVDVVVLPLGAVLVVDDRFTVVVVPDAGWVVLVLVVAWEDEPFVFPPGAGVDVGVVAPVVVDVVLTGIVVVVVVGSTEDPQMAS
jgi:hypothetical protein